MDIMYDQEGGEEEEGKEGGDDEKCKDQIRIRFPKIDFSNSSALNKLVTSLFDLRLSSIT